MIGIDEVGRGCWAGPLLVVAARAKGPLPPHLADSKVLSRKKRQALHDELIPLCSFGEGWVTAAEIDATGLGSAMRLGVERALSALSASIDEEIIMDGLVNYCPPSYVSVTCQARADANYPIVSAASIYAKVRRDGFMEQQAVIYPEYGFDSHVGYGTAAHTAALQRYGVTSLHRKSFKPILAFL